jgi:C4-dicarboxylate transporter DctQ subunit
MQKSLRLVDTGLAYIENSLIVLVLGIMVVMAFLQVILRNLFDTGILWGDIFLRHLVLWVGFIGASLATRQEKHINIDLFTRIIPKGLLPYVKMVVDVVSAVICALLARAGYLFLTIGISEKATLFYNIPTRYFAVIIPVGFGLIGFRFLLKMLENISILISKN